eukprot:291336_1
MILYNKYPVGNTNTTVIVIPRRKAKVQWKVPIMATIKITNTTQVKTQINHGSKHTINPIMVMRDNFNGMLQKKAVPEKFIYKADQWIALTRHHAWPLISLIDEAVKSVQTNYLRNDQNNLKVALWHCFQDVKASDEIYFPTTMALLGILGAGSSNDGEESQEGIARAVATKEAEADNSIEKEIAFKRVTYCDWSENARNPASFVVNPQEDAEFKELNKKVILARDEGCLFARKFIPGGNISINSQDW